MNVLITGCSRGIGREWMERYLKMPAVNKVYALTQHADSLKSVAASSGGKLVVAPISVSEEDASAKIKKLLEGATLDLLINNAGMYPEESDDFEKIDLNAFREGFEVNVLSTIRVTQACVPALKRSKNAKVISVSSLMGSIGDNGMGGSYAYRISKNAINMFNKCFAIDYPSMIAVVVHPGWVKTDMGGSAAPTTVEESVSGLVKLVSGLSGKDTGKFYDFEGEELPW